MKYCIILFLLFVGMGVSGFSDQDYQNKFTDWMHTHHRVYDSENFLPKFSAFKSNMDFVTQLNSRNLSMRLELNDEADMTHEEFREIYLRPMVVPENHLRNANNQEGHEITSRAVRIDWRESGGVSEVRNQGTCGACWAFVAAASVESLVRIEKGITLDLSEQNLMDCTPETFGCNGGYHHTAFQYIIDNEGIANEESYPYENDKSSCRYNSSNKAASISGYKYVRSGSEASLMAAVEKGPVAVGIDASLQSFKFYSSGIYNDPDCSSSNLNHAVLVVGYDTDADGNDYWIVKNSWGTAWGNHGYVLMSRNKDNQCGIATYATYPSGSLAIETSPSDASTLSSSGSSPGSTSGSIAASTSASVPEPTTESSVSSSGYGGKSTSGSVTRSANGSGLGSTLTSSGSTSTYSENVRFIITNGASRMDKISGWLFLATIAIVFLTC